MVGASSWVWVDVHHASAPRRPSRRRGERNRAVLVLCGPRITSGDARVKRALEARGFSLFALLVLAAEPNLYGRYEWVLLPELDRTLVRRSDTGAYTSSLSAKDIELFQRDGEEWVRFRLATKEADGSVFEHCWRDEWQDRRRRQPQRRGRG